MADVFPRRNLPAPAEPWGREHDNRVLNLERGVEALNQGLSGQNRSTASSLAVLAEQLRDIKVNQDEILARVTLYGEEPSYVTTVNWGDTLPFDSGDRATVNLSLTEGRHVYIRSSIGLVMHAFNSGTTTEAALVRVSVRLNIIEHLPDGTDARYWSFNDYATGSGLFGSGEPSRAYSEQKGFVEDYVLFPPGEYTISTSAVVTDIYGTAGASARMASPKTSVQVLQRW